MKEIYFAGGCFWGTQHYFKQIEGVFETSVGYANGHTSAPTYEEVYTDTTGFAETVCVLYDETKVSLRFLVEMFFLVIDPTSLNQQGEDKGTRYRTGVYYTDESQIDVIRKVFDEQQLKNSSRMVVELMPLESFYRAEEYHQNYLDKNPQGYCHLPLALFEYAKKAREQRK